MNSATLVQKLWNYCNVLRDDGNDTVDYAFMGDNPDAAENRWLREAMENRVPVIYFLGVAPGRYQAFLPTFIVGWVLRNFLFNASSGVRRRCPSSRRHCPTA